MGNAVPSLTAAGAGSGAPGARHAISVIEHGSFATARCTCGWRGPARRARDRARRDAAEHLAG